MTYRTRGLPPVCHPERPHRSLGLCTPCYNKHTARRRRPDPLCGHPDRQRSWKDGTRCVDCYHEQVTVPRKAEQRREDAWRRLYGITPEQYGELLAAQDGRCAICRQAPGRERLHVDHNHRTGEIRGLLCRRCNRALGLLGDDADTLLRAADYCTVTVRTPIVLRPVRLAVPA